MTVTTNSLGSNSAEIVVYNESRYDSLMSAVDSFVTSHGWTAKAGVGNDLEKVYTSANAAGGGTKEIKINAIDLHIQHADSFTGTTTVTATNEAVRWVHNEYLRYPENLWTSTGGSNDFNGAISETQSLEVVTDFGSLYSNITGDNQTFTLPAGLAETLYPGQFIRLVSQDDPTRQYIDAIVQSHNNVTGVVTFDRYRTGIDDNTNTISSWYLLAHCMAYNTTINPAYVYISASSKHIAIQCRNTDGVWHDFHAVCETENPLAIADASILTTGYMLGNSGYVEYNDTSSFALGTSGNTSIFTLSDSTPEVNFSYNRFRIWTGPYSQPSTRKNRTGFSASRFTKITTPLGEAEGCIGAKHTIDPGAFSYYSVNSTQRYMSYRRNLKIYYRGMGDVIPAAYEPVTGNYWAVTGNAVSDLSDNTALDVDNINNYMLDTWLGGITRSGASTAVISVNNGTSSNIVPNQAYNTGTQDFSWSTQEPTLLGRIYNIKFVTTGLKPTNILSIKVDANGFVDDSGSAADHLVFSYVSDYKKDLRGLSGTSTPIEVDPEDSPRSEKIKQSQSAAVAFPK